MLKHRAMDTPIQSRHTGKMLQIEKMFAESTLISISYNPVAKEWRDIKTNIYVNSSINFTHLCNSSSYAAVITEKSRDVPNARKASWNISFQTENFVVLKKNLYCFDNLWLNPFVFSGQG